MRLTPSAEYLPPDSSYAHVYFSKTAPTHWDIDLVHKIVDDVILSFAKESEILKDRIYMPHYSVNSRYHEINYSYYFKWNDLRTDGIPTPDLLRQAINCRFRKTIIGIPDALCIETQLDDDYHHFVMEAWAK